VLFFWLRPSPVSGPPIKPVAPATLSDATSKLDEAPTNFTPRIWNVAKVKLDGIDCTSIAEALGNANPGDSILITDRQVYEENLVLNPGTNKRGFRNITIKAEIGEDGKRAKLTPPATHAAAFPLVSIEN